MDNQPPSIITLITQMRDQGLTEQDIRSRLLLSGWAWPIIDQAFTQLASQTKHHQPPAPPAPPPSLAPKPMATTSVPPAAPTAQTILPSPSAPPLQPRQPASVPPPYTPIPIPVRTARPTTKPGSSLIKKILLFLLTVAILAAIGYLFATQIYPRFIAPRLIKSELPYTTEQARQDIRQVTEQVFTHLNQQEYAEALSYFGFQYGDTINYEEALIALAIIRVAYQQNGTVSFQLTDSDIQVNNEIAQVTLGVTKDSQPHQLILDFHFSHWHITNIRFDSQLDYLNLADKPEVITEMFARTQFSGFLPEYRLSDNDSLIIIQTQDATGQPQLTFNTSSALQGSYLISIFEPPVQPHYLPLKSGQTIDQSFPLTTDQFGVISVYDTQGQDPADQQFLSQLNTVTPLLRLPFEILN